MKLVISTPSNRDWKGSFGYALTNVHAQLLKDNVNVLIKPWLRCSNLASARQSMVEQALDLEATHILFVDDDMCFTYGALKFLLSRNLGLVGANCVKRGEFTSPATMKPLEPVARDFNGSPLFSAGKTGIEKVSFIGLGFTLIQTEIFSKIDKPYFAMVWSKKDMFPIPEDAYLCEKLSKSNIDVYVDHDAAKEVWHIGDYFFQEKF